MFRRPLGDFRKSQDPPRVTPAAVSAEPCLADLLARGRCLAAHADDEAAKRAYLDALKRDPACLEALLELARLALRSGHRSAALTCCRQAAYCHPEEPAGHVNLGGLMIEAGEFEAARAAFAAALALAPNLAAAHQGMARALTALGDPATAEAHWRAGFAEGWLAPQPYRGARPPVSGAAAGLREGRQHPDARACSTTRSLQ